MITRKTESQLSSEKSDSLGPEPGARIWDYLGDVNANKHGGKAEWNVQAELRVVVRENRAKC